MPVIPQIEIQVADGANTGHRPVRSPGRSPVSSPKLSPRTPRALARSPSPLIRAHSPSMLFEPTLASQRRAGSRRNSVEEAEGVKWENSLRCPSPRLSASDDNNPDALIATVASKLTKVETLSQQLNGEKSYFRARALADGLDQHSKDLKKIKGADDSSEKKKQKKVTIPAPPGLTRTMSVEAQYVRLMEYQEEIEKVVTEGRITNMDQKLLAEVRKEIDISKLKTEDEKCVVIGRHFDIVVKTLHMMTQKLAELES